MKDQGWRVTRSMTLVLMLTAGVCVMLALFVWWEYGNDGKHTMDADAAPSPGTMQGASDIDAVAPAEGTVEALGDLDRPPVRPDPVDAAHERT